MSFEDEWHQHQANAAARQSTSRPAGQMPGDQGSDRDGMSHLESEKAKAASYIEETLGPEVSKAGVKADTASAAVTGGAGAGAGAGIVGAGALNGWETQKGLQNCLTDWDRQLKKLSSELTRQMNSLRSVNTIFQVNETDTVSRFTPGKGSGYPSSSIADF
ncbi:hypothetical protein LHJ74_14285 [Streptomyces sp. N2-109]|uniref:Uncharacterized protein n=1 Tax=Streptomyces gossypii TaxID=2883101 RepID=A0ABT2JUB3_9ACTN|nr:hypothetical protein [Streptomyces gossypii]MCT2591064.1 hypothetical protein [Streptomyces gossypii]